MNKLIHKVTFTDARGNERTEEFTTDTDGDKFYAMGSTGCSKCYATRETAIREMLLDHCATNIRVGA